MRKRKREERERESAWWNRTFKMSVTQTVISCNRNNLTLFQTAEKHVRIYRFCYKTRDTLGSFKQPRVGECEREMANIPCDQFAQDDTEMREAVPEY